LAQFNVEPGSSGQFAVIDLLPRETASAPDAPRVEFEAGAKAPDQPWVIKLTEEHIRAILGPKSTDK
jgi:hypothetical protein